MKVIDYHYCRYCGFRMLDAEYMSIIVDIPCPGRGDKPCNSISTISTFLTAYKEVKEEKEAGK